MGVRGREHESLDEGSIDTDPVRAWFLVPGAWKVHGFLVPGATLRGLRTEHEEPGTLHERGTTHEARSSSYQEFERPAGAGIGVNPRSSNSNSS